MAVGDLTTTSRLDGQAVPAVRTGYTILASVTVIGAYLVLGIVAFWPVCLGITHHLCGYVDGDFILFTWFLAWVPHALGHGLNPFFSNDLLVPSGVNLAGNTTSPLLGLLSTPLSVLFGPVVTANLVMVLAMPISATAAFIVLRRWRVWIPAAALGGLMYGVSPYMVGQSVGHPEMAFVPLPPFIALTVVAILQRRGSPQLLGITLGLLVTAQYLISQEVMATVTVLTIAALVCVALRHPSDVPRIARAVWRPIGIALVLGIVLLAYPVWMMLAGPQHYVGTAQPIVNPYHNDLLSFVVPGPLQRVPLWMHSLGVRLVGGSVAESGGYIGIPLLLLSGVLAWKSRRSSRMQLALVLLLCAVLLSLGPHLSVDGHVAPIPLPFLLLDHIPLFDNILPTRVSFEMGAFLASMIAFGLDDIRSAGVQPHRHRRTRQWWTASSQAIVVVVITLVVLVTQLPRWPYVTQPVVTLPARLRQAIPPREPVAITYPFATVYHTQPELWQVNDGYAFRLLGGYAYHPDVSGRATVYPDPMRPGGLETFLVGQEVAGIARQNASVSPPLVAAVRSTLSRYDVKLVIVDRSISGSGPVMKVFSDALGRPRLSTGPFTLWIIHSESS